MDIMAPARPIQKTDERVKKKPLNGKSTYASINYKSNIFE